MQRYFNRSFSYFRVNWLFKIEKSNQIRSLRKDTILFINKKTESNKIWKIMEQQRVSKIDYGGSKRYLSRCELNFNSLSHMIWYLYWSWDIFHQKNNMFLYWIQQFHWFIIGSISSTKVSANILFSNKLHILSNIRET